MIKGKTRKILEEDEILDEYIETSEGNFELWKINVDVDGDGKPFETPRDLDIRGLAEDELVRAMFPMGAETHAKFIRVIEGSSSSAVHEGYVVDYDDYSITFDNEESIGFLMFNAKIQQLKNILFHRKIDFVYVLHVY